MKLHPEDPRLTAFLLGELQPKDAEAVERAIAADPALQAAIRELEGVRNLLTTSLTTKPVKMHPVQRENILRTAKSAAALAKSSDPQSWVARYAPLAAAAAFTLCVVYFTRNSESHSNKTAATPPAPAPANHEVRGPSIKLLPAPGPVDPGKQLSANLKSAKLPGSELPSLRPRSYLAAVDFPTLDLPVQSGKSSLDWIKEAVLTKNEKPNPNAVRIEEILNTFTLRPAGITVIARTPSLSWHPDARDNGKTSHAATISTETLACPWKPSATLLIICIRGNPYSDCEIKAAFKANPDTVHRYRLLGFSPVEGHDENHAPLPTKLAAKSSNTLVIEIDPSTAEGNLGTIEWSVNDQSAAPVNITKHGSNEPSDDARFAALICTYAQWLTQDPNALIDTEVLAALARETASSSLSSDRAEFLSLIDRSLNL